MVCSYYKWDKKGKYGVKTYFSVVKLYIYYLSLQLMSRFIAVCNKFYYMSFLEGKISPVLYRKNNLISLVVFTAVFALLFINIYEPFDSPNWYDISQTQYFLYSSLLILTGVMVVVISRIIMYFYTKKNTISYLAFAIWVLLEIIAMSFFYTIISFNLDNSTQFFDVFKNSIKNTTLILLLPYIIHALIILWKEKSEQLKTMEQMRKEGINQNGQNSNIISFYDEKGDLKLSIKKESLYYIESADNYVSIWYFDKQKVSKYLLRSTLKNIEEKFAGTSIIRCHRTYIVNFDQVKVAKKTKNGIYLDLGLEQIPEIPVSRSYGDKVTKWFISSLN